MQPQFVSDFGSRVSFGLRPSGFGFPALPACVLSFFVGVFCAAGRGQPPQYGIPNFGRVDDHLYRGAQPGVPGIENLKRLGVGLIINLRMPGEAWTEEAAEARANGIAYTNVPMRKSGWPSDAQIRRALSLVQTSPVPVFVHCLRGCDRTGTVIACYRIEHDRWSSTDALGEAKRFGMSWRRRGMKHYVTEFGRKNGKTSVRDLLHFAIHHQPWFISGLDHLPSLTCQRQRAEHGYQSQLQHAAVFAG